jgi:hypothetical protein
MKKETIAKFIGEYKGDNLASALSAFIAHVDDTKRSMKTYYAACDDEHKRRFDEAARLYKMLEAVQSRCCHAETETCYGPYENYTSCLICNKELSR